MRIVHGDCLAFLRETEERWDTIIADPPDNLGLAYGSYFDRLPAEQYYQWLVEVIQRCCMKADVVWISYYHSHDFEIKYRLKPFLDRNGLEARTFIWSFTFGQNRDSDCGSGYRPILRINRPRKWNTEGIKVPSWREQHGDKRAAPGGRVPLDVWEFPRVTGNSPERRSWHPTQHPEALYIRMLKMSLARRALDPFGGTGTMLRAAAQLGIDATVVERDPEYCRQMGGV